MIGRDEPSRVPSSALAGAPWFQLARYTWEAPDRPGLSGTLTGLETPLADPPVLVLSGAKHTYRLPAAAGDVSGAPENGQAWHAAFAWQEAPAAFQRSVLEPGPHVAVDLPEPGADVAPGEAELGVRYTPPDTVADGPVPAPGVEQVGFEAELLAAREELREAHAAAERTGEELARARADLDAEREARAADAVRFRKGLAKVRESAEEALAVEQSASRQLGDDRRAARKAADASESALAEARIELAAARAEAEESRRRIESARGAFEEARAGAEALLERLIASGEEPGKGS